MNRMFSAFLWKEKKTPPINQRKLAMLRHKGRLRILDVCPYYFAFHARYHLIGGYKKIGSRSVGLADKTISLSPLWYCPIPPTKTKNIILGKVFNSSLKDTEAIKATRANLEDWLRSVDKSGLPGRFKAWVIQHRILPCLSTRFQWRLWKASNARWAAIYGLPRSLSNIALYGSSNKLRLPFSSVRVEFVATRTRERLQYNSRDNKVSGAVISVRTGRRWRAVEVVQQVEIRLRHKAILGTVAQGRAGLRRQAATRYDSASGKERRKLVEDEVRASVEEEQTSGAVAIRRLEAEPP